MRSNIASTCGSARRPAELMPRGLLQARQEVDELVELLGVLLLQRRERRHRRGRGDQRPRERPAGGGLAGARQGAGGRSRDPIWVRGGPGPALPFSPILWQPRQPEDAATSLPFAYCGATFMDISVGDPAMAPRIVRYAIAAIVRMPAIIATGRWNRCRFGLRSMNGSRTSSTIAIVGMPTVAMNTSAGGFITRSNSKRKK